MSSKAELSHWVQQTSATYYRCDGALVFMAVGGLWTCSFSTFEPGGSYDFVSATAAIYAVDEKCPVKECRCPDNVVMAREIEEAMKEGGKSAD